MITWLRKLFSARRASPPGMPRTVRLRVEALEDRRVPTVTYHGGALLSHVEVQAVYLGSDWSTPAFAPQTQILDNFLTTLISDPYMDRLTAAGYNVGRGMADTGRTVPLHLDKKAALTDDAIQRDVQSFITTGILKSPDANRLYVVFVEDNVVVLAGDGSISRINFLGYHGAFLGRDAAGRPADIRYAVVAYPGGTIGNASVAGASVINDLTVVASHEIAEAATNPDVNYSVIGWYDDVLNEEVADIVNQQFVMLDGYAVQRVADKNGQAMTPAGAAPLRQVTFALLADGRLYEHSAGGWMLLASGVSSVSDQAIDIHGEAMVDVVLTTGQAYEYHDGDGWVPLSSGVRDARAGQGVSYVLQGNGHLAEYRDGDERWSGTLASGVAAIDAGTDSFGVNMVDVVYASGTLAEYSDSTGWHALCGTAQAVSAGQLGVTVALLRDGRAFEYREDAHAWTYLGTGVVQVAGGTDIDGAAMIEVVNRDGTTAEYRATGRHSLGSHVASVSKPHDGLVDVIFMGGDLYEHTASGSMPLCGSAREAA
jgi:hypothetical protein